ncbi:hypothetical protein JVT61DRAFT_13402 [Boletus reticuloceps]|uniref:Uncharacterized protein n=1 Tax=Boletus reticuloceps TaxID=495285 RepID=A0A8I2YD81_9AGAM|nr:hypothetical protein JVT61DRAFT_13402 [Boletus reticuloceps]
MRPEIEKLLVLPPRTPTPQRSTSHPPGKTQMDSPHLPSESSLTDLETEASSESALFQRHLRQTLFQAPFPPNSLRESHLKITETEQLHRIAPSTVPHVGTPSAFGAIHKSSGSLQIAIPAVSHGSSLSRSSICRGIFVEPQMGNNVSLTLDKEFDEEEAQLGLELARARHTICRLERELVEARCQRALPWLVYTNIGLKV